MNIDNLSEVLEAYPAFRFKQAQDVVFKNLRESWQASNLPAEIRAKLEKECPLEIEAELIESSDRETRKALIKFRDDKQVETVLLRHKDGRNTVCVSSQIGCALGCVMCATGKLGFSRNLSASEILEQIIFWARELKKEKRQITNIVFMGMGEPFLNFLNFKKAVQAINNPEKFNISLRRISVSTVGIPEGIGRLSKELPQVNLAISLHAPNNKMRDKLIPFNKKARIEKLMQATKNYIEKNNRRVMIEYAMFRGVNDSEKNAQELVDLLQNSLGKLYFVNLIAGNRVENYLPSEKIQIRKFKKILESNKISVIERYSFGRDCSSACGQLGA